MSLHKITRGLSVFIPRCRLLLQSEKASKIARTSVGLLQTTLEARILPAASFCASIYNPKFVFLKLERVPSNVTEEDIRGFFNNIDIKEVLFQLYNHDGTVNVFINVLENDVPEVLGKDKTALGEQTISVNKELDDDNRQMIDELQREKELEEYQRDHRRLLYFIMEPVCVTTTKEDVRKFFSGVDVKEVLLDLEQKRYGRVYIKASESSSATVLAYDGEYFGEFCVNVKIIHQDQINAIAALHDRERRTIIMTEETNQTYIALGRITKTTKASEVMDFIGVPTEEVVMAYKGQGRRILSQRIIYCLIQKEHLDEALQKHKKCIGDRYITVREATLDDMTALGSASHLK